MCYSLSPRFRHPRGSLWLVSGTLTFLALNTAATPAVFAQQGPTPVTPLGPPTTTFLLNSSSDTARSAFDSAYAAFLEFDFAKAHTLFERAFAADTQLRLARAFTLGLEGRDPARADSINRLWIRNGGSYHIESLMFMSLREYVLGRSGAANLILRAASRNAPADNRLLIHQHNTFARGNVARIRAARELRNREPGSYVAHGYVALALTARADTIEATEAMNEALRLGPDRAFPHWVAGEVMTLRRRYDDAIAHYGHALRYSPDFQFAFRDRAAAHLYAARPAQARSDLQEWERVAMSGITKATARRAQALTYLHERNPDEAIRRLNALVQQLERDSSSRTQLSLAHQHLAVLHALRKDVAAVERHIAAQGTIYDDEEIGRVHYWTAIAWSIAGQPVRARAALDTWDVMAAALDIRPAAAERAGVHAMVQLAEGKREEAIRTAGNYTHHFALLAAGQALGALGRTDEAEAKMRQLEQATGYALDVMALPISRFMAVSR
jgi:tetratricopeptide (TPR) repeat protein